MPEERICPACGRSNALASRTCENCGAAIAGALLLKQQDATRQVAYSSEFPTVRDGSWREVETDKRGSIPLPPQIQAEARRREMEWEQREAEQQAAATRRAETERRIAEERERRRRLEEAIAAEVEAETHRRAEMAATASAVRVCARCRTVADVASGGASFTFCLKCGTELPPISPTAAATGTTAEAEPQSYREAMLERRARYRQQVGAAREANAERVSEARSERVAVHEAERLREVRLTVSPLSAAVWSFLLPGVGQMLNGQVAKGALLLLGLWIATAAFDAPAFGVVLIAARLLIALDAYRIGERRRRGRQVSGWEWSLG